MLSSEEGLLIHPHETAGLVGLALVLNDREGTSPLAVISLVVIVELDLPHRLKPKYWSFSFSISPSNEYSGLISFRMDWLNLHAVQGTLKSLLQHHSCAGL